MKLSKSSLFALVLFMCPSMFLLTVPVRVQHSRSLVIILMFDLAQILSQMPFLTQPSAIYPCLGLTLVSHWTHWSPQRMALLVGYHITGICTCYIYSDFYLRLTLVHDKRLISQRVWCRTMLWHYNQRYWYVSFVVVILHLGKASVYPP